MHYNYSKVEVQNSKLSRFLSGVLFEVGSFEVGSFEVQSMNPFFIFSGNVTQGRGWGVEVQMKRKKVVSCGDGGRERGRGGSSFDPGSIISTSEARTADLLAEW